jgi:hypothetical protein
VEVVAAELGELETVTARVVLLALLLVEEVVVLVEAMEPKKEEEAVAVEVRTEPVSKTAFDCLAAEEASCLLEVEDVVCGYLLCFASWRQTTCWRYSGGWAGPVLKVLLLLEVLVLTWLVASVLSSVRTRGLKGTRSLDLLQGWSGQSLAEASRLAYSKNSPPVSTPAPVFRSFGIPPAKRPPSCGAPPIGAPVDCPLSL